MLFQSTLPRRERRCIHSQLLRLSYFNPRSREGSDDSTDSNDILHFVISIHAPAKGATKDMISFSKSIIISIHAPAKGATSLLEPSNDSEVISIHAPAKGATGGLYSLSTINTISIHAPAKGATHQTTLKYLLITYFNPRSREGSDDSGAAAVLSPDIFQSTLPRRERRFLYFSFFVRLNFNPRSREGSDNWTMYIFLCLVIISIHAPAKGATI